MWPFKKREQNPKPYIRNIAGNFRNEGHIHVGDPEVLKEINNRLDIMAKKIDVLIWESSTAKPSTKRAEDDGPSHE